MKELKGVGFWFVVATLASSAIGRTSYAEGKELRDVVYREAGEIALKLDLYLPAANGDAAKNENASPAPVIVWVHGGAWRAGTKEDVPIRDLTKRGYAIASVQYRLSTDAKFPAQTVDIHSAVRFLRANAETYGIDPGRIAVAGSSAGAHLAALVGATEDVAEVGGKKDGGIGSEVAAIVSFYGASNLESILDQSTPHSLSVRVPALRLLLGGSPTELPDLARMASPVAHVGTGDPPLLLIHGDADPQMPYAQAVELRDAYRQRNLIVELVTVEGGVHGGERFYDEAMLARVADFLDRHLTVAATNE